MLETVEELDDSFGENFVDLEQNRFLSGSYGGSSYPATPPPNPPPTPPVSSPAALKGGKGLIMSGNQSIGMKNTTLVNESLASNIIGLTNATDGRDEQWLYIGLGVGVPVLFIVLIMVGVVWLDVWVQTTLKESEDKRIQKAYEENISKDPNIWKSKEWEANRLEPVVPPSTLRTRLAMLSPIPMFSRSSHSHKKITPKSVKAKVEREFQDDLCHEIFLDLDREIEKEDLSVQAKDVGSPKKSKSRGRNSLSGDGSPRMSRNVSLSRVPAGPSRLQAEIEIETSGATTPVSIRRLSAHLDCDTLKTAKSAPPLTFKGLSMWAKAARDFDAQIEQEELYNVPPDIETSRRASVHSVAY
jgi:hypothetical protein